MEGNEGGFFSKIKKTARAAGAAAGIIAVSSGAIDSNSSAQDLDNFSPDQVGSSEPILNDQNLPYKLFIAEVARDIPAPSFQPTEFGFNTHLSSDESSVLDFDRFKDTVDDLAMNKQEWIRFNIPRWEGADLSDGELLWNEKELELFDDAIKYAKEKNLQVFLVAAPPTVDKDFSSDDYARITHEYFTKLAGRYSSEIDMWQINNEIDVHHPADYSLDGVLNRDKEFILAHVKSASEAIKKIDSDANITVNVTGWPMNDTTQRNWEEFIEPLTPYINAVSLDLYPNGNKVEIDKLTERVNDIKERFNLPIYISETGVCTIGCDLNGMTQKDIIIATIDALLEANPRAIIIYEYTDEDIPNQQEGSFGITDISGNEKPGYDEITNKMQK